MSGTTTFEANWYPDPYGESALRWWDGAQWTGHVHDPPPLRTSQRVAVIDVETTGFGNVDRILEIAVVVLDSDLQPVDEWETLVNAGRDCGPEHVHGIAAWMVQSAPCWDDLAGTLAQLIDGAIIAGHNLPFDTRFIVNEYNRIGVPADLGVGICTYRLSGMTLGDACQHFGVTHRNQHCAAGDATATAHLLRNLIGSDELCRFVPATIPCPVAAPCQPLTRAAAATSATPPAPDDRLQLVPGMKVCFTGTAYDKRGEQVTREDLWGIAEASGMEITKSVTLKTDVVVAGDPSSVSQKARTARDRLVPIVSATEFLEARGHGEVNCWR